MRLSVCLRRAATLLPVRRGAVTNPSTAGRAVRTHASDVRRRRRENYLGHSLHGQIGRWTTTARGSDLTWWSEGRSQLNRTQAEELQQKEERRLVKEAEEDAMREAM